MKAFPFMDIKVFAKAEFVINLFFKYIPSALSAKPIYACVCSYIVIHLDGSFLSNYFHHTVAMTPSNFIYLHFRPNHMVSLANTALTLWLNNLDQIVSIVKIY